MSEPDIKDVQSTTSVIPRPNVEGTVEAMNEFQKLKQKVLNANDTVTISGKQYIKRSGWRKIAMAFNISTEIVKIEREKIDDTYVVRVIARAKNIGGRVSEEAAVCDSTEFERGNLQGTLHNIETKAVTRAINRAISNLVGGGEVSAEEIVKGPEEVVIKDTKETQMQKEPSKEPKDLITTKQYNYLQMLMKDEQVERFVEKKLNGRKLGEISKDEASDIIDEAVEM
jgi:hypothetical protein